MDGNAYPPLIATIVFAAAVAVILWWTLAM